MGEIIDDLGITVEAFSNRVPNYSDDGIDRAITECYQKKDRLDDYLWALKGERQARLKAAQDGN